MNIEVTKTSLPDAVIIDTDHFQDERGFFVESYHRLRYAEHGIVAEFVQDNLSRSGRGVLRGIHYQAGAAPMAKLVRCITGAILDVAVDLRASSPTLAQWEAVELTGKNHRQFFIPGGFGHAFIVLSDDAIVSYKCTSYYDPSTEGGIAWNDPDVGIDWPISEPILSQRDKSQVSLAQYLQRPVFTDV